MRVLRIIAYILYFLMWSIALILGGFLFTDKGYIIGVMGGSLWGSFTLFITILVFLTLAIAYRLKKEKDSAILKAMRICALPFIPALLLLAVLFIRTRWKKSKPLSLLI